MAFARLFKSKKACASCAPLEPREAPLALDLSTYPIPRPTRKAKDISIGQVQSPSKPQITYFHVARHDSMIAQLGFMEDESAPCESWRDEDSDFSVVSGYTTTTTATAAPGLIPTTDSWLCNEFPSLYCNEVPEDEEEEISPMSSTETLVEASPRAIEVAAKIEAIALEVPPKKDNALLHATLVPLWVAQQQASIKYRLEGFELKEEKNKKAEQVEALKANKVWWKKY